MTEVENPEAEGGGPDPPRRGRARRNGNRRRIAAAVALLFWDAAFSGSCLTSLLICPIWFLVSLVRSAIQRSGWERTLVRLGFPAATLAFVMVNDVVQRRIARGNADRLVTACEAFHDRNGRFPRKLDELVPQDLASVPIAKYCLGPGRGFLYFNFDDHPMLAWVEVPPYGRRIYNFETRTWGYLD